MLLLRPRRTLPNRHDLALPIKALRVSSARTPFAVDLAPRERERKRTVNVRSKWLLGNCFHLKLPPSNPWNERLPPSSFLRSVAVPSGRTTVKSPWRLGFLMWTTRAPARVWRCRVSE